ncbi:MAG: hypothetical protein JW860_15305 [Sedimentisphaerales bacterium]|nr:hypothetical protein [Sedimentisphaerales bacterium]
MKRSAVIFLNVDMTAYTSMGPLPVIVPGHYPTVYKTGSPPYGPIHWHSAGVAHLGGRVSKETEADYGYDQDPTNNIIPPQDLADMDGADDGVEVPLNLPHCRRTRFDYLVSVQRPLKNLYVNVWLDWNRDGDWDDISECHWPRELSHKPRWVREWAVRNQVLTELEPGIHQMTTPPFLCRHPWISDDSEYVPPIWMRITLSEKPWSPPKLSSDCPGYGGSGPKDGYWIGETEDYFFTPTTDCIDYADLNCSNEVNLDDINILASQWLTEIE